MDCNTNLIKKFMSCEHEREAIEITENFSCPNVLTALADGSGGYIKFSKTVQPILGMDESQLLDRSETIFSLSRHTEKLELFRAFSNTLREGSSYRIMHYLPGNNPEGLPVITHLKKILNESGQEMLLCLNILA